MRFLTATAVIAATVVAATLPLAAAADVTLGANLGSARLNAGDFEGDDTGWKAHAGLSFNEIFGAEVGYIDFGRYGVENRGANAWTPALTLGVPIGFANIYAKGGYAFADIEGVNAADEAERSNRDPFYGAGVRVGMNRGLGLRLEYERYQFDRADIDMAMAGLELSFGRGNK
ncbi:MAG TPA: outer membrane beta-barrel protein [Verrucomicrobiae bacterium]|nr:outer membrane beta-barrel protein [Verrucomicrobiae bacterium]